MINLAPQTAYGLELASPVLVAAGCWGYAAEYARVASPGIVGAIVTSTTSLRPRPAAAQPRILETPAGLLWAGDTPNPGVESALRRYGAAWAASPTPIVLSIVGTTPDDYLLLAEGLEGVEGIAALEICLPPDPALAPGLVAQLRATTPLPLLVKLPHQPEGSLATALALAIAGADALVLPGTAPGLALQADRSPRRGVLCGPAIRPLALLQLSALASRVEVPLVAGGGVASADDARALLELGASAVQIGSAAMADPSLPGRVAAELSA